MDLNTESQTLVVPNAFKGNIFWLALFSAAIILPLFMLAALLTITPNVETSFADKLESIIKIFNDPKLYKFWRSYFILITVIFLLRVMPQPKLLLNTTGIEFVSGVPLLFQLKKIDWRFSWNEISDSIYLDAPKHSPISTAIIIKHGKKQHRIRVKMWGKSNPTISSIFKRKPIILGQKKAKSDIEKSPLMEFFKQHDLIKNGNILLSSGDVLNACTTARVITFLFVLLTAYIVFELQFALTFAQNFDIPAIGIIFIAAIVGTISLLLLKRDNVELKDNIVMSILLSIGVSLACIALWIRLTT